MRHIPDDELHAYLDQGLSRSQCVEIESHLAVCRSCQAARDGIAAMRDRTTALLARLAPPRGFPPEFESLRRRAASQVSARRKKIQLAAWAASIIAAVGLGWSGSLLLQTEETAPGSAIPHPARALSLAPATRVAAATPPPPPSPPPAEAVRPPRQSPEPIVRVSQPVRRRRASRPAVADSSSVLPTVVAPPALELSSNDLPRSDTDYELDGMWRTMSWAGAQAEAGDRLPHIDGLPVVQVQVQASEQGKQPLMVVAQQLSSGEVIRTIEGPTNDVSHLLARRTMTDPKPPAKPGDSATAAPDHTDRTMAMQRGDRMLVITGALPPDSLLAMIRRLNAEMRSK